jgi:hypothetical protein
VNDSEFLEDLADQVATVGLTPNRATALRLTVISGKLAGTGSSVSRSEAERKEREAYVQGGMVVARAVMAELATWPTALDSKRKLGE